MKAYHADMSDEEFDDLVIEKVTIEFSSKALPTTGGMYFGPVRMGDLEAEIIKRIHQSEAMGD